MRTSMIVVVAACASRAPVQTPIANSVPGWSERCAQLIESSVRVDAAGIDHLVVPVDDRLRACWRAAFEVVDARKPNVIAPSCRALRFAEPPPSERWLASCRRYEVVGPQPHVARVRALPPPTRPSLFGGFDGGRRVILAANAPDPAPFERVVRRFEDDGDGIRILVDPPAPLVPPYDLTPAAKQVCAAVADVTSQFASHPSPQLPLVVDTRWDRQSWTIVWPSDSAIAPIEDALTACLSGWSVAATSEPHRVVQWTKAPFTVELVTSPERKLSISKR